ncbi:Rab family GTPase [Vibrio crassostreae]|uniref:Rab family GTPase n=1 Tax=Vibrio crassostreae TaxID=246167 RepID=UPI001B30CC5A|nr:hypothetical protein [Vibrio crassostreae]
MNKISEITEKINSILDNNQELPKEIETQLSIIKKNVAKNEEFLEKRELNLVFIGAAGVGKTSLVSRITNLIDDKEKPLLQTSSGKTTLCEVEVRYSPVDKIEIIPVETSQVEHLFTCFSELIAGINKGKTILSTEQQRFIRKMTGLTVRRTKNIDGGTDALDLAQELFKQLNSDKELFLSEALNRANLPQRTVTEIAFSPEDTFEAMGDSEEALNNWIKKSFKAVNLGENRSCSMPSKIIVHTSKMQPLKDKFPSIDRLSVFDTKGLDEQTNRKDLDLHIENPSSACIFCSRFNDAPDSATRTVIKRAVAIGNKGLVFNKSSIVVLERNLESQSVILDFDLDEDEENDDELKSVFGRDERRANIENSLKQDPEIAGSLPVAFVDVMRESTEGVFEHISELGKSIENAHLKGLNESLEYIGKIEQRFKDERSAKAFRYVNHLMKNRMEELKKYRKVSGCGTGLVDAIKSQAVYSSSLAASTRRYGHWDTIDFHHEMQILLRNQLVKNYEKHIDRFVKDLKLLRTRPDFSPTHEYLTEIIRMIEFHKHDLWQSAQRIVEDVYSDEMVQDEAFWDSLIDEWGRGAGYKKRVAQKVGDWFESRNLDDQFKLEELTKKEWKEFVWLIRGAF